MTDDSPRGSAIDGSARSISTDICRPAPVFRCRDCPPGSVIADRVYRVERREKAFDVTGRLIAVERRDGFEVYCEAHYERCKRAGQV